MFLCKIGLHKWVTIKEEGYARYIQCGKCNKRRIIGGHQRQPLDKQWIETGEFIKPLPPVPEHILNLLQCQERGEKVKYNGKRCFVEKITSFDDGTEINFSIYLTECIEPTQIKVTLK
jgi:hypothetical protein